MEYQQSPDTSRLIGKRIRAERIRRQKTQEEFSRLLGISPSYLGALERGNRPISRHVMELLHTRLGISYDYLMEGQAAISRIIQNTVREPGGYRVRRDLSLMLSGCTPDEAQECYDLLHTYLNHSRARRKAQPQAPGETSERPGSDLTEPGAAAPAPDT